MSVTLRLIGFRAFQGGLDGFAHDELLAKQTHRKIDALADQRLTPFGQNPAQCAAESALTVDGNQFSGQHQAPGGRINEQRWTTTQVRCPVAMTDFVANQTVNRRTVRNAQQRLRETHQSNTFVAR